MEGILQVLVVLLDFVVIFGTPLILLVGLVIDLALLFSEGLRGYAAIVLGLNVLLAAAWSVVLMPTLLETAPIVHLGDGVWQNVALFGLVVLVYAVNIGSWVVFWQRSLKPDPRSPVGGW
jgi:hypothetical protein